MNARTRRPHAALVIALAAVVTALLTAPAAQAATRTTVGLKASSSVVSYDRTVKLSGQVRAGSRVVKGVRVQLNRKSGSGWRKVAVSRTSHTGGYAFTVRLRVGGTYRVSAAAGTGRTSGTSGTVGVRVRPPLSRITASGSPTAKVGSTRVVRGSVTSGLAGTPVQVQAYHRTKGWRTAASGTVARDGSFAVRVRMTAFGQRRYQVLLPARPGFVARTSNRLDLGTYGGVVQRLSSAPACDGAAALGPGACDADLGTRVTPAPGKQAGDTGNAFSCYVKEPSQRVRSCTYGSTSGDALKVAVTGDSHGATLVPALRSVADTLNWRVDAYVGRGCVLSRTSASDPCRARIADLARRLKAGDYDVLFVTAYRGSSAPSSDTRAQDYAAAWRPLVAAGTKVVAVADNPRLSDAALRCLESARTYTALSRCSTPRSAGFSPVDPIPAAAALAQGVIMVDVSERQCTASACPVLVGHVLAYRDQHHLTATYARTLMPYILEDVVGHL